MDEPLEDLLHRLAGESNAKTQSTLSALAEAGLYTVSDVVFATETEGARNALQEEIAGRTRDEAVQIPSQFMNGLRMAIQESRLAYRGFPEPPPATKTAILFTAPHAIYLARPGHKPHKPEAYTQHLARDFAETIGGVSLTWTRREEARAKEYYTTRGEPDPTNADPNFTHRGDLDVSPWTRNLKELRCLFGMGRPCLHVDLHGCKDPGQEGGSDLIVGLGAMQSANRGSCSFFKLALTVTLAAGALKGYSVNLDPTKLTGVSPDADRRTLTQQSVSEEGGAWTYAVQLELSRSLRLELARNGEMRFMLAKSIQIALALAYAWQHKPADCVHFPLAEVKDWLRKCRDFHSKREKKKAPAKGASKEKTDEGNLSIKEEADLDEATGGAQASGEGTSNREPTAPAILEPIAEDWADQWVRSLKNSPKHGLAKSLDEWFLKAAHSCGHVPRPAPPVRSESQVLREWYRAKGYADSETMLGMMIAKASSIPKQCYIVGTWCDWQPNPMDWDGYQFSYLLEIRDEGWESFQIRVGTKSENTVHPSCADANPYMDYRLQGPDDRGHGKNWTIGIPPGKAINKSNMAKAGEHYQVIVTLDEQELPCRVTWKTWS